jgi:phosphoglycolate phosphatase-like HAD superfamily hydrolase
MHLVLFDVDGTLIRGQGLGRLALERAFDELFDSGAESNPAVREVHLAGSTDPQIVAEMARALGIPPDSFAPRREEFEAAYIRHLHITVRESPTAASCPGVKEVLDRFQRHPEVVLGLLTGNIEAGARVKLGRFGLDRYFSFGGFGGDGRERKDLAAEALSRARAITGRDIAPRHTMVIGDTVHDIRAGRANGFVTVAVGTGWASMDVLREEGADAVFEDLTPENGFERWLEERWGLTLPA